MGQRRLARALVTVLVLEACQTFPDVAHPQVYQKDGVSFQLPGNWEVTKDESYANNRFTRILHVDAASLGSSAGVFLCRPSEFTLEEFAALHRSLLSEALDSSVFSARVADFGSARLAVGGEARDGVSYPVIVSLLGEETPSTVRVFEVAGANTVAFLVLSAPDEDWASDEPGFRLFSDSFAMK